MNNKQNKTNMEKFKFELGQKARDIVTGYEGVIVSRTDWMTGCNTYGMQSSLDKDGKVPKREYFDENQLQIIDEVPISLESTVNDEPGGPHEEPQKTTGT